MNNPANDDRLLAEEQEIQDWQRHLEETKRILEQVKARHAQTRREAEREARDRSIMRRMEAERRARDGAGEPR
jgi:hypothetical protein